MIIRKLFKFEGSHVVRNCTSNRCSHSIHGHSYQVEVFIESKGLDGGQMVIDFGLLKENIGGFIDAFDHTHVMWVDEKESIKSFFREENDRWIILPCSPSAEMLSVMFFDVIDSIISVTGFQNGEKCPVLKAVRVHETATGWAEANLSDRDTLWHWGVWDIVVSPVIQESWSENFKKFMRNESVIFINPKQI